MTRLHAEEAAVIEATPATIYAILSDYRVQHPQILPKEAFPSIEVEQGGQGAGTVFRVTTRALGVERRYHMLVSEPEPGRKLVETDSSVDLVTTFTIEPVDDGKRTRLTIATDWNSAGGLSGLVERLVTGPVMRRIYRKELGLIAAYVARNAGAARTA